MPTPILFPAYVAMTAGLTALMMATMPAAAISRIETTRTDCADIRATLVREGAAILRYTSKRGLPIYDRYVSDSLYCPGRETGVWASVPARDTNRCRVISCDAYASDDDDLFRFKPRLRIAP